MQLLKAIKRQPADNCVVLTYNADLLFFERLIFEPLYAAGCRNTLVLCDPAQYEVALADVAQLRYAGQRYLLLPGRTSPRGAFHPKLILLTSSEGGRLLVTSGNLTKAGYMRNWEVATLFEYDTKVPDAAAWAALRWAYDAILQVVAASDAKKLGRARLEQLLGTTPWLRNEPPALPDVPFWLLHNLEKPLLEQVLARYREQDGTPVDQATVVSPFFDPGARAVARVIAECSPRRLSIYTHADTHGLAPRSLAAVLRRYETALELHDLDLGGRFLHAKALLLRTARGAWMATGSANLSRPAWLHPAASGNTEMVVLRFDPDAAHFDPWLAELTAQASPLDLDWDAEPIGEESAEQAAAPPLTLLSATLDGGTLELDLVGELPPETTLTVCFVGETSRAIEVEQWEQDGQVLALIVPKRYMARLEGPALVTLEGAAPEGAWRTRPVLLHNVDALRRYGRPVDRRERPRIPEGMVPESYEHCALLLEMIHDLLATNAEQLRRHRRRIVQRSEEDERERRMTVEGEGEYDMEEHFVEERVEVGVAVGGAELYADFYDRLTYEELLRAALAAGYHPVPEPVDVGMPPPSAGTGSGDSQSDTGSGKRPPGQTGKEPPTAPDDATIRAQVLARIERGFNRLVGNLLQGITDDEYLTQVPPQYLIELFAIITTYLRVVWRDGMLATERFVDHSLALLTAFWGEPRHPGAWQTLRRRITERFLAQEEERVHLHAQTWLHAYVLVGLLEQEDDRRVYDLAAWMRHFGNTPDALAALPEEVYRGLWRASFPPNSDSQPASEVIARLHEISQWYDDVSLLAEIASWPGARARTSLVETARLTCVPELAVTMPLSEAELDRCLWAFVLFLTQPQPKQTARACFTNANPLVEEDDLQRVIAFYRGDRRSLVFAAQRKSRGYHPDIDVVGIRVEQLRSVGSVTDLDRLGSAS